MAEPTKMLNSQKWEIEAALLFAEVPYGIQANHHNPTISKFKSTYSLAGDIIFLCTKGGQKYCIAIVKRNSEVVLFCSFAGTHLPGDWEKANVKIFHETDAREVGAPGHAGFLQRALEVPLEGIERLALEAGATRMVFCGHSLGGAVSHFCLLRLLFGLQSQALNHRSLLSIGVGSPFFGGEDMLEHIKRHDWLDCFITLVNGNDPVPRVMNLAATLVDNAVTFGLRALFDQCTRFLSNNDLTTATHEANSLAKNISSQRIKETEWDSYYVPIGYYVFFPMNDPVMVQNDTTVVSDHLGSLQLFRENPNVITGLLNTNSLAHHTIRAYQNVAYVPSNGLDKMCMVETFSLPPVAEPKALQASELEPEVYEAQCETFASHEQEVSRIIRISGRNLDLIGRDSAVLDTEIVDSEWSQGIVKESWISRRTNTALVIEQSLRDKRSKPRGDIDINLRSDVVVDGNGAITTQATLLSSKCYAASDMPQDVISFFGGQFLLDTQQHAWICKNVLNNDSLERKLKQFVDEVKDRELLRDTDFLEMKDDWASLEEVGGGRNSKCRSLREDLYKRIVPPGGLVVRTKGQSITSVCVVLGAVLLGGGIVMTGGLGIMGGLLGLGGSLTGGYGTAALTVLSGGGAGYFFFRSRLRTEYYVILEDLIKIYTGETPQTKSEMDLEEELLVAESNFEKNLRSGKVRRSKGIELFDGYDNFTQKKLRDLIFFVRWIHTFKKERIKSKVVAVCGPRDSGKTTLLSQLRQDSKLALRTGVRGGTGETLSVSPYSIKGVSGYVLLDTPGLTGPEDAIRQKFEHAALNLASVFVYIRRFDGLPTEVDLRVVERMLDSASRTAEPKILICLNRAINDLCYDAVGDIEDEEMTAQKLKVAWLTRLLELRKKSSKLVPGWLTRMLSASAIQVEFVELAGGEEYERELDGDSRTRGIWTTSSIGKWLANAVSPKKGKADDNCKLFMEHMESFDYTEWRESVKKDRQAEKRDVDITDAIHQITL